MIRNIIFDMGGVLIRFDRETFLNRHAAGCTPKEKTLLLREVYLSAEWIMQDRGTHTPAQTAQIVCRNVPEKLHKAVEGLVGVDLPDDAVQKVVDGVKVKLAADKAGGVVDKLKSLF